MLLKAVGIDKSFGQGPGENKVLKDIHLNIENGEYVSIMGPSGSGKSTLLYCISGMDTITDGKVYYEDQELSSLNSDQLADLRRKEMGFVFQKTSFVKSLDILDNILLKSYKDTKNREKTKEKAINLMEEMGIENLVNRDISQISGGQLQRAAICRSILNNPKILFGDEPTGALNSQTSKEIMDLFDRLNKEGMTLLIVTHDAHVAARTNRVVFLKDGEIEDDLDLEYVDDKLEQVQDMMRKLGI